MDALKQYLLPVVLLCLAVGLFFALLRTIRGPRLADRIMGINMIGSLSTACIAILAVYLEQNWLLDVSLIYCMISFLAVVVLAKIQIDSYGKREGKEDRHG